MTILFLHIGDMLTFGFQTGKGLSWEKGMVTKHTLREGKGVFSFYKMELDKGVLLWIGDTTWFFDTDFTAYRVTHMQWVGDPKERYGPEIPPPGAPSCKNWEERNKWIEENLWNN